jgi:hypothetical protein
MTFEFCYELPWKLWFTIEAEKRYLKTYDETFYWVAVGPLIFSNTVKGNHGWTYWWA